MSKKELVKRYVVFLVGLFISSLGVSFVTKANLGTSPISSIPYVLSLSFWPTLGQFTMVFSILLIVFQIILRKKDFKKEQFLQVPVSILFGFFIDMTMLMLKFLNPEAYFMKIISLLCGCIILAVGVFFQVIADVVLLPGEAFVKTVSDTFHTEFGFTKIIFDTSMTVVAGILSVILLHQITGVREGTVAAALSVGWMARIFNRKFGFVRDILFQNEEQKEEKKDTAVSENG